MKKILLSFFPVLVAVVLTGSPSVGIAQATPEAIPLSRDAAGQADGDFSNALNQLRQSRQDFKSEKTKEANETAEVGKAKSQVQREAAELKREQARTRMEDKRKEVLLKLVDIQIKWMNRTKERVQRMPNITDELKAQLVVEVDKAIQNLNGEKAKIEAASGRDSIKALAKEIRQLFKSNHEVVKEIVDAIHASRANYAIAKAEERSAAIEEKIKELKNKGKSTDEVESELKDAQEDIDGAQDATGRKAFKEASEDLKGAYQKFRSIAGKAKGL